MSEPAEKRVCAEADRALHLLDPSVPVHVLDAAPAFAGLAPGERRYAHHVAAAGFEGSKICLFQTSWEAPGIFALLQRLFAGGCTDQVVPQERERGRERERERERERRREKRGREKRNKKRQY